MELEIVKTLHSLGLTSCYKGFPYTVYTIQLTVYGVSYGEIRKLASEHFDRDWTAIRQSIHRLSVAAWGNGNALLSEMAGRPLPHSLSVSEFIGVIASHVVDTLP